MESKKLIQSVQRASQILKYICEQESAKLNDICKATGLNKSTAFGLIQTLEYEGHLSKTPDGKQYTLGINSLKLGLSYLNSSNLESDIREILKQLVEVIDETGYFIVKIGERYHYIDYILSTQPLKVMPEEGKVLTFPDYSAVGQVYKSYQDEDFEYGIDIQKVYEQTNCFAVPYYKNNDIVGCFAITGPSFRYTPDKIKNSYETYNKIINRN